MKFCSNCQNMLYISVDDDKLRYQCKNCNFFTEENHAMSAECIISNSVGNDEGNYTQFMSKYIKHDPTLPRINNIPCTNASCPGKGKEQEVIYIKYDHKNMQYIYYCCHCETFWK